MSWVVTGGGAYIGAHIVESLAASGLHTIALDNLSIGHAHVFPRDAPLIQGDLLDTDLNENTLRTNQASGAIHVAGYKYASESVTTTPVHAPMTAAESAPAVPPFGVKVTTDLEHRPSGIRARARWIDPQTRRRVVRALVVPDEEAAEAFFRDLLKSSEIGIDRRIAFADYLATIGDRWTRGLDPTSTADGYKVGLRLRVLPALGQLPLSQITAGMIDRTIDDWEQVHSASTIKNSIAPLVRVLDEAVRDDVLASNPARNRSRRSLGKSALIIPTEQTSPRAHALPDLATLNRLAEACGQVHQSYSDFVML